MDNVKICKINAMFDERTFISASYDTNDKGVGEHFEISGYIAYPEDDRFICKQCSVRFQKGDTYLFTNLDKFAKQEGFEKICGRLTILKDLAPEKWEDYGKKYELPPLQFVISLEDQDFYTIEKFCENSISNSQMIHVGFEFSCKEFQAEKDTSFRINNLNVSEQKVYSIVGFSLHSSPYSKILPKNERIIRSPEKSLRAESTSITISINKMSFKVEFPGATYNYISCEGIVHDISHKELVGLNCIIDFHEYEMEVDEFDKEEYPKEAFAGNFRLFGGKKKHPESRFIGIDLRFKKVELTDFVKHIFLAPVENKIFITCSIAAHKDSLRLESKEVQADITNFTITNYKYFS